MRRFFVCALMLLLPAALINAQNSTSQGIAGNASEVSQTLMPLEVYAGDVAELRYTFRSAVDYFKSPVIEKEISVNRFPFEKDAFTVKSAKFTRNDKDYSLVICIIPWRPGIIDFPVFDLFTVLGFPEVERNRNISYKISLEPVEIKSIVEKTGLSEIQPPCPPLIIPGTSYVLFAIAVLIIIFLILFFRFLIKFRDIRRWIAQLKIRYAYRRNSIITIRRIRRLLRNSNLSDIDFCASLQNVTRSYLEFRFDYPFTATSAAGMSRAFEYLCSGEVPPVIAGSVDDLTAVFVRTDYIRYAHDSIDSKRKPALEHQAKLSENERQSLARLVFKAVDIFESDGCDEEEQNVL